MPDRDGCDVCQKVAKVVPLTIGAVALAWLIVRREAMMFEPAVIPWPIP